jgi:hypothetical protein
LVLDNKKYQQNLCRKDLGPKWAAVDR